MPPGDGPPGSDNRGHFFAVDQRVVPVLADLGMTAFASYLVIARGTGHDQRTSSWSAHAIEERTTISRASAKAAITALIERGLVQMLKGGARPRYRLTPAHEVEGTIAAPLLAPRPWDERLLRDLNTAWQSIPAKRATQLTDLVARRLVERRADGCFRRVIYDAEAMARPDWCWLPNALVDAAGNEVPPLELVRQTQDVPTLRLLVDLYDIHDLASHGGVSAKLIFEAFERTRTFERAEWTLWEFASTGKRHAWRDRRPASAFMTGIVETVDGRSKDTGWRPFWAALAGLE